MEPSNTILLLHPCAILRAGMRSVLEPVGIQVVGEATDAAQAFEMFQDLHPKMALLDASGPSSEETLYLTALLVKKGCHTIVFDPDDALLMEYKQLGALAYVRSTITGAQLTALVEVIQQVVAGLPQISLLPSFVTRLEVPPSPKKPVSDPSPLTTKELAVLRLIMHGLSNKQVSSALNCDHRDTIKYLMISILRKLHVHNRTHAVVIACKLGLLSLDELPPHELVVNPEAFAARWPQSERRVAS